MHGQTLVTVASCVEINAYNIVRFHRSTLRLKLDPMIFLLGLAMGDEYDSTRVWEKRMCPSHAEHGTEI